MERIAAFDGDRDGPFERIVYALVMSGAIPIDVAADAVRARLPDGRRLGVVRFGADVEARLRAAAAGMWRGGGVLILVGGPPGARPRVVSATPSFIVGSPVVALHVDDDGGVEGGGATLDLPLTGVPDWDAFWTRVADPQPLPSSSSPSSPSSPAAVSVTLGALILAMFAVELIYRCLDLPPALNRLGALIPGRVRAGEVWRLGSSMFLHASVMHVGMNLLAFASLGPPTERALGRWRFALLYALSGIGGGIAATFMQRAPAVGASGAIWGLMTASLVLAWRVRDRLPPELWKRVRAGAIQSLVLNLVISAMPGIAWSAHLGGGLVGALVALAFGRPEERVEVRAPLKAAAIGAMAFVILGALRGVVGTDMEIFTRPPTFARASIGAGTAELPVGLSRGGDLVGDPAIDPGAISVTSDAIDPAEWKDFTAEGDSIDGEIALRWYRREGLRIVIARRRSVANSPTALVMWWDGGPWDAKVGSHVLRSYEPRVGGDR